MSKQSREEAFAREVSSKIGKVHIWQCQVHGAVFTMFPEYCFIEHGSRWCTCEGPKRTSHCPRCRREQRIRVRLVRRRYRGLFDGFWARYYEWKATREKAERVHRGMGETEQKGA